MGTKPTYEELEQRVKELENETLECKRAEEAIRESEEKFRNVVENANDGLIIASSTGAHLYANRRASEITGYSVEEILTVRMDELALSDEIPKLFETLKKRINGEEISKQYETVIVHKDGKTVPIEITGAKTFWQDQVADITITSADNKTSPVKRLLFMDDEKDLRNLSQRMLEPLGYKVDTVKDGVEAIETYKKNMVSGKPFDAVILDLTIRGHGR